MLVPTFCESGSTLLSSVMLLKHLIQFDLENDAMCDKYGKFSIQVNAARLKPLGLPTARAHDIMPKLLNDVTTDAQNPPQYSKAQIGDMSEQNKKLILETYPDLKPLKFPFNDQATVFGAMLVRQARQFPCSLAKRTAAARITP